MQTRQPMLSRAPPRGTSCQLSPADSLRIYIAAKAEAQRARSSQPAMPTTEEKWIGGSSHRSLSYSLGIRSNTTIPVRWCSSPNAPYVYGDVLHLPPAWWCSSLNPPIYMVMFFTYPPHGDVLHLHAQSILWCLSQYRFTAVALKAFPLPWPPAVDTWRNQGTALSLNQLSGSWLSIAKSFDSSLRNCWNQEIGHNGQQCKRHS